jgi:hypothetical protein
MAGGAGTIIEKFLIDVHRPDFTLEAGGVRSVNGTLYEEEVWCSINMHVLFCY